MQQLKKQMKANEHTMTWMLQTNGHPAIAVETGGSWKSHQTVGYICKWSRGHCRVIRLVRWLKVERAWTKDSCERILEKQCRFLVKKKKKMPLMCILFSLTKIFNSPLFICKHWCLRFSRDYLRCLRFF